MIQKNGEVARMTEPIVLAEGLAEAWVPEGEIRAVVLLAGSGDKLSEILPYVGPNVVLAAVRYTNWNHDFSPWTAPAVFGQEDFTGGGPAYLEMLLTKVVPAVRERWPDAPLVLAGYSLAGLFAVWAAAQTDAFDGVASMSGSLWFDGFGEYMQAAACHARRVYLSVGDKEKRTRNVRMQQVEAASRTLYEQLMAQGIAATFELNQGNHFQQVPERIAKGINWICQAYDE